MTDLSIDARLLAPDNDRHGANLTVVAVAAAGGRSGLVRHDFVATGIVVSSRRRTWPDAVPCAVRVHLGLARLHCRTTRRRPSRPNGHACAGNRPLLPGPGARHSVRRRRAWRARRGGRGHAHRGIPVRPWNAAWRRLRVGNALYRRRRQHPHACDTGGLHRRIDARCIASAVVERTAEHRRRLVDRTARMAAGARALLGCYGCNLSHHPQGRDRPPRRTRAGSADEAPRRAPLHAGAMAAAVGRDPARDRKFRHAVSCGTSLGHHLRFRALGIEDPDEPRRRRRVMALLAGRSRDLAAPKRLRRHHLRHGFRHHPGSVAGRRPRRQIPSDMAHLRILAPRRHHRRPASRLWRPARLWLQYRRLFQRDRIGQPAWLVLAGGGFRRRTFWGHISDRCSAWPSSGRFSSARGFIRPPWRTTIEPNASSSARSPRQSPRS